MWIYGKGTLVSVKKCIAKLYLMCYIPNYQIKEDKSMNTFCINSLRRRERRRKLL